jgi:hypothetical protein
MTDLEAATTDELIAELKRRSYACAVLFVAGSALSSDPKYGSVAYGQHFADDGARAKMAVWMGRRAAELLESV